MSHASLQIMSNIQYMGRPAAALQLGETEYWWEYVQDGQGCFYRPIFDNANRASLASGLFHHFVFGTYHNPEHRQQFVNGRYDRSISHDCRSQHPDGFAFKGIVC
jgi:hypothetical protein